MSLSAPDALLERAIDLERVLGADPLRAREALRGLFVDGRLTAHAQPDGSYVVEGTFLPLVAMRDVVPSLSHAGHESGLTDAGAMRMEVVWER